MEDIVELLDFDPLPDTKKRKNKNKKDEEDEAETAVEGDENMNKFVTNEYSDLTKNRMAALSEKDISFELIEVRFFFKFIVECSLSIYMFIYYEKCFQNTNNKIRFHANNLHYFHFKNKFSYVKIKKLPRVFQI